MSKHFRHRIYTEVFRSYESEKKIFLENSVPSFEVGSKIKTLQAVQFSYFIDEPTKSNVTNSANNLVTGSLLALYKRDFFFFPKNDHNNLLFQNWHT